MAKVTQTSAMIDALKALPGDADNDAIHSFIKEKFGLDLNREHLPMVKWNAKQKLEKGEGGKRKRRRRKTAAAVSATPVSTGLKAQLELLAQLKGIKAQAGDSFDEMLTLI